MIGDEKGRSLEQAEKDEEWFEVVWEFLKENMEEENEGERQGAFMYLVLGKRSWYGSEVG